MLAHLPSHSGEIVVAYRVWHWSGWADSKDGGFIGYPVLIGTPFAVEESAAYEWDSTFFAGLLPLLSIALLCFLAGLLALLLYAKQPSSPEYLWFGLLEACTGFLEIWEFVVFHWIPITVSTYWYIFYFVDCTFRVAFVLFFFRFVGKPVRRWPLWLLIAQAPLLLFDILESSIAHPAAALQDGIDSANQILLYIVLLWLVFTHWKQSRAARRLAMPLLLIAVTDLASWVRDVMKDTGMGNWELPLLIKHPFQLRFEDAANLLFLAAMAYILIERFAENQSERTRLTGEFEAARTVQQVLIPDFLPPVAGLAIQSAYLPAQEVGGDFFQVLPLADGTAFVVVGDVSGKGLKAAMTVSLIVGALRTEAEYVVSPAAMLAGLNRRLYGRGAGFATCLVLQITPKGGVTIANAGHPSPYLDGVEVATESNFPLGITLDAGYVETQLRIERGQTFTLVTDGVVEATAPATRELFGFERTQAISRQAANAIAEAAQAFGLGAPQTDDITVLTVARV
jgi:serine phosphatase RsbU (regulator of sigma subunit)